MGEVKPVMPETGSRPDWRGVLHVRTRIDSSWYLAFVLLIFVVITQLPEDFPLWQRIAFGTGGILVFFLTVNVRQFLLNLLVTLMGIPLKNVTLFVFGGAARIPRDDSRPPLELIVAGGGILLNLISAGTFQWLALTESASGDPLFSTVVQWLAFFWYTLALFHLLPAFPLEGGRVLLAILWKRTGDHGRAVRISTATGWGLGLLFVLGGIAVLVLLRETVNGLLLTFLGWVLLHAARLSRRWATLLDALHEVTARDVMTREFPAIRPQLNLRQVVRDYSLITGQHYFPVAEGTKLVGVVTVVSMNRIPRGEWDSTLVEEVMTPAIKVSTVQADQTAAHAVEHMDQSGEDRLPVLDKDEVVGVIVRHDVVRLAKIRRELGI